MSYGDPRDQHEVPYKEFLVSTEAMSVLAMARLMRAYGIEEVRMGSTYIRIAANAPELPEKEPMLDPSPAVNAVHLAAFRKAKSIQDAMDEKAAADEIQYAATEGLRDG